MAQRTPARRLRLRAADFLVICEREGWVCHICHKPVDHELEYPHPLSRSQEHSVPLSRDGRDDVSNIRLAHLLCNRWKWARLNEELIGLTPPEPGEYDPIVMELVRQAMGAAASANASHPWTPSQRTNILLAMSRLSDSPKYHALLAAGQQRRRQRERAKGLSAYSEDGAARIHDGRTRLWADPRRRAAESARRAATKQGTKDSPEARAAKSVSARRAYAEGRKQRVNPKLTEEIVREIRRVYHYGMARELAERYGVSPQLIQDVAAGRRWKHIT